MAFLGMQFRDGDRPYPTLHPRGKFAYECAMRTDAFFYGLYMDEAVLAASGVAPQHGRKARLDGFALKIGKRATLVREKGASAWGMVYALTEADLGKLYGAPGLEAYRPEMVEVVLENRAIIPATVYNLPEAPGPGECNPGYAGKLKAAMTRLGFPADYIARIA
jgi:hypothetical protein